MPSYPHIERYHAYLGELIEAGSSDSELNIRPAFLNCLAAYCNDHKERVLKPLRVCTAGVNIMDKVAILSSATISSK